VFVLGQGQAIAAFEQAVLDMRKGGMRRIEIPGELEEQLAWSRDPKLRYNVGPVPSTFSGKRTLDFVLDNKTLKVGPDCLLIVYMYPLAAFSSLRTWLDTASWRSPRWTSLLCIYGFPLSSSASLPAPAQL